MRSARDVAAALRTLLRIRRHRNQLPAVLLGAADVHERRAGLADLREHLVAERSNARVGFLRTECRLGGRTARPSRSAGPPRSTSRAVTDPVGVVQRFDLRPVDPVPPDPVLQLALPIKMHRARNVPLIVRGKPVVLVAVEHDRRTYTFWLLSMYGVERPA